MTPRSPEKHDPGHPTPDELAGIPVCLEGEEQVRNKSRNRVRRAEVRTRGKSRRARHSQELPTPDALAGIPACPPGKEDSKI